MHVSVKTLHVFKRPRIKLLDEGPSLETSSFCLFFKVVI